MDFDLDQCILGRGADSAALASSPNHDRRISMGAAPVEVKKTPIPAQAPDVWQSFRTEMDRLFDRFAGGFGLPSFGRMFDAAPRFAASFGMPSPAIDIAEEEGSYKLTAELPGMAEKDIEISLTDDVLTIKGEKKQETEKKEANFYLSERAYGAFQRSFVLPDKVDTDKIGAEFAKGVLTVTLPKLPEAKAEPKKIEVKQAA
jgi:HSP20 family protein